MRIENLDLQKEYSPMPGTMNNTLTIKFKSAKDAIKMYTAFSELHLVVILKTGTDNNIIKLYVQTDAMNEEIDLEIGKANS